MDWVLSVSFGELTLKGDNRKNFEDRAIQKILQSIKEYPIEGYYKDQGKVYIEANREDFPLLIEKIKKVFGIVYISPCLRTEKNLEDIEAGVSEFVEGLEINEKSTFKMQVKRSDKGFTPKSPELNPRLGGVVLRKYGGLLSVDVHDPDYPIFVDIKRYVYIYTEKIKGWGGLPIGSSGRGLLLLSGGIDSPVAGFLMGRRGVEIAGLHFHSYPFTSDRGFEKVQRLAQKLSFYLGNITLYSINLLPIQREINKKCRERYMTILSRRFMMKIGERICRSKEYDMMVTGESLGQVASQTIQGITVVNAAVDTPILRPLVGMDKNEIIDWSREIDTYDISIEPFEDCCTVFLPKRPVTKPRLNDVESNESLLDAEELIEEAIDNMEVYRITEDQIIKL